jgi:Fic family protein
MNYLKIPVKVEELCALLQEKQKTASTFRERYELSFNAHLNFVSIHPWVDGNGRTARLLINYIQFLYRLFPTKIFKDDREAYILSLRQCQGEETNRPFLDFMAGQLKKSLSLEIERSEAFQKKGFGFLF